MEAVNGTQITVSEYNNAGTGVYGVRVGTASQLNFQKFIHFGATPSVATPPPPPPARILIRQGNSLLAKDGIGDTWTKLVDGSTFSYAVAGNRIAFLDGSHGLNIKEGLGGPWVKVADNVDDFRITDSRIVIRQDGTLLAKDGIGDTWTTLTNGSTSNYAAAGNRIAFVDSSGGLNVKEGLGGSWVKVANQVDDFRLTDSRIVVRQGAELSAKDGIGDTWTKLTDGSTSQFSVAGNRIAFKDGSGGLNVKEGIGGPWVKVANQIDDFRITGSRIIVRQSDVLSVKDGLGDMWTTLTNGSTPNYSISGNRIAFLDGSGGLNVKEGIGGTWVKVADGVNDFGLGDREAPFGAVDSAGNQLKIGGKGAGVRVSCHTQPGNDCHFRISANAKAFFGHKHSRLIKLPNRAVRVSSGETVKATIKLPKSIREIRKKAIRIVVEVRVQIVGESQTSELRMVLAGGKRNH